MAGRGVSRTTSTFKTQRRKVAERLRSNAETPERNEASGLEEVLVSLTRRSPEDLLDDHRLAEDLGLSSLERIDMLASLEDRYGIELEEQALSNLSTLGQVREWVAGQAASAVKEDPGSAHAAPAIGRETSAKRIPPPRWARTRAVVMVRGVLRRALFHPLFRHYIPPSVEGVENLERVVPPVIFAANHTSHLDTVALTAALPSEWQTRLAPAVRQQHFFPTHGTPERTRRIGLRILYYLCCGLFNAYPLSQDLGQVRDSLRYTGELVEAGFCPLVYPEGGLTPNGSLQRCRPGIGLMSLRLEVPVVPVHLHGLFDVMSMHDPWPRKGSVRVEFGSPVVHGEGEDYVRLAERIEASLRGMAESRQR